MSKDYKELDDLELENVNGGTNIPGKDINLLMKGDKPKASSTVNKGAKKKASSLVLNAKNSDVDGKDIVGDFADKSTLC